MKVLTPKQLVDFLNDKGVTSYSTPQFERIDGLTPSCPPDNTKEFFDMLPKLSDESLRSLGLGRLEEGFYLYPKEWYAYIPEGYPLISILGQASEFKHGRTDNDYRFGCLAYGFKVE